MRYSLYASIALAAAVTITSCKKKDDPAPIGKARVQYVNAAVGNNLDVYENNSRVYQDMAFKTASGYRQVDAKSMPLSVTATGTIDPKLLNTSINPPTNGSQTYVVTRQSATGTNLQALVLTDTITGAASGKAMIRFVNAAPSSGGLQLTRGGTITGSLTYPRNYREFTRYAAVDAGTFEADARSVTTGTTEMMKTLNLTAGKYYTVIALGEPGGASGGTSTLDLLLITNE